MKLTGKTVDDDPLTFLMKYDLIRDGKLSNAAYLLFKKNDSILTTIELGYFQNDIIIKDSDRSKEDILTQVDRVMDFVRKHINKEVIITGEPQSIHRWQYPLEAIREIVMNMIIHRDYRLASDSIVKVYPDKIEFYNPGRLPDNITVEDLLANNYKSTPRNKQIADFCKDLGIIEKYGSGIRRILDYFRKEKQKLPLFGNISDGFMVTVFSDKVGDKVGEEKEVVYLSTNQYRILELLAMNSRLSAAELSENLGISKRKIETNLAVLKSKGFLERIGSPKSGYWKINK